jgi:hypothetical protein
MVALGQCGGEREEAAERSRQTLEIAGDLEGGDQEREGEPEDGVADAFEPRHLSGRGHGGTFDCGRTSIMGSP